MDEHEAQPNTPIPKPQQTLTNEAKNKSYTPIILGVIFVLLGLIGTAYLLVSHNSSTKPHTNASLLYSGHMPSTTPVITIPPVVTPVTATNVDETLNNTDTKIQQAMNQANSDVNDVNNIDTSQDNTSNL